MIVIRERQRASDLSTLFSWFIIYSGIGWIYETTYCYLTTGNVYNRGFLYGPLIPIYGLSILSMILLFEDRCKSLWSLFLSCALVATVLEYVTSYWMEAVFNKRWWNYSKMMFNIEGRICLGASILFGICGVLFVRFIHPTIVHYLKRNFSDTKIKYATRFVFVLFTFDVLLSFQARLL